MKLVMWGEQGHEKPGAVDGGGNLRDLSSHLADLSGAALAPENLAALKALDLESLPLLAPDVRLGAPVSGIGKIIGIGLNYSDHAAEAGMPPPSEPVYFMKAISAVSGPYDDVLIPRGSVKTDWEVELAFVIGRRARYVEMDEAMDHVAGYTILNDVSERAYQLEMGSQWTKGKSCDTFAPIGPWLVTCDEIADPHDLVMWLEVDGHRYQNGNTSRMIFGVAELVSYLSRFMTLEPGDVITTGTPPGVGLGQKPPVYLRPGQTMRLGIAKLGEQRQHVRSA